MVLNRFFIVIVFFTLIIGRCNAQQLKFMGIPICSDLSKYEEVLKTKKFKDRYQSGDLAHRCWEDGDFWKISKCDLHLFTSASKDDLSMQNKVTSLRINLPFARFNYDIQTYKSLVTELLNDFCEKYGKNIVTAKRHNVETGQDDLDSYKWIVSDGEVEVIVNWNAVWAVDIEYKSAYLVNKIREASKFKGAGIDDL